MISKRKYQVLNQISIHTKCRICGKRNRRYRYCAGDGGCQNREFHIAQGWTPATVVR